MKELLFSVTKDDFRWDTFRCGGKGGQNVNKRSTGVRCTHTPSGAVGKSCDERTQLRNRMLAWERCVKSREFNSWVNQQVFSAEELESINQIVERELATAMIEVREDGEWVLSQ